LEALTLLGDFGDFGVPGDVVGLDSPRGGESVLFWVEEVEERRAAFLCSEDLDSPPGGDSELFWVEEVEERRVAFLWPEDLSKVLVAGKDNWLDELDIRRIAQLLAEDFSELLEADLDTSGAFVLLWPEAELDARRTALVWPEDLSNDWVTGGRFMGSFVVDLAVLLPETLEALPEPNEYFLGGVGLKSVSSLEGSSELRWPVLLWLDAGPDKRRVAFLWPEDLGKPWVGELDTSEAFISSFVVDFDVLSRKDCCIERCLGGLLLKKCKQRRGHYLWLLCRCCFWCISLWSNLIGPYMFVWWNDFLQLFSRRSNKISRQWLLNLIYLSLMTDESINTFGKCQCLLYAYD
jgi:hypothetical protein